MPDSATMKCYFRRVCAACAIVFTTIIFMGFQEVIDDFVLDTDPVADAPQELRSNGSPDEIEPYVVLIATFRRDDCLQKAVPHYLTCSVREVRVKWQDFKRPIPDWLQTIAQQHPERLVIDIADGDYLSSRFKVDEVHGEAVFTTDDDLRFSCQYMREAFRLWRRTPNRLVGYQPRRFYQNGCYKHWESGQHIYYPTANTLFATKGAFLHPKYLKEYFSPKYEALRKIVDGNLTSEDMLMSFAVALANPPGERWVVPLYGGPLEDDQGCAQTRTLSQLSSGPRCAILQHFQDVLGFPFEYTPWSEFCLWDKDAGTFLPFSESGHWAMPWYPIRMFLRFRRNYPE